MAYRLGIRVPRFPHRYPLREPDLSHPDIMLERNRCIQCARCVRASQDLDHKHAYDFVGRGGHRRIALSTLRASPAAAASADQAMRVCPVGCLLVKRVGYRVPIGQRRYDARPIGSELEPAAEQEQR